MMKSKLLLSIITLLAVMVPKGVWADADIFSMSAATAVTGENTDYTVSNGKFTVVSKKSVGITATYTNGTATLYNGKSSDAEMFTSSNGVININGSSDSYIKIELTSGSIQAGDIISVTGTTDNGTAASTIKIGTNASRNKGFAAVKTVPYIVQSTDEYVNQSTLYFFKHEATIVKVTAITITRPQPATPVFSPATGESAAEGSKITVTSTYATSIQYQWTASNTTPTDGWSDYNSTDKVTVPSAANETPYLHVQCTREGVTGTTTAYAQYSITSADNVAPALVSTSPAAAATDIAVAGDIVLTFDENVACTTNATLTPEGGEAIELTPVVSGTTVTYSYTGLAYQKAHTFALAANSVEDVSGNKYASAIGFSFTTAQEVVADPTFDNKGGYSFTIACATEGATIYYTVDDADPVNSASKKEYTTTGNDRLGIKTSGNHTVYAYAVKAGAVTSGVVSLEITVPTSGDNIITQPLTITLQPASAAGSDTPYENNTFTKNGFLLSSTATLANTTAMSNYGDANVTFKANTGTLTVTAPDGVTIQAIKVYAMRNANGIISTIGTTDGHTRKSSSNRIIPRYTYDYDSGVGIMSEHVIMKDEPDNTCQFTIGDQCRLYVEVYTSTITTNAGGWTSYTPVKNATLAEGASAYIVTDIDETTVTAKKVTTMKAGEGYFIKGASSTNYAVTVTDAEADDITGTLLKGCSSQTTINASTPNANSKFVLGTTSAGVTGLYAVDSDVTIKAGKAYLDAGKVLTARMLTLDFVETTGITEAGTWQPETKGDIFNLNGQKVTTPAKGLYIVDGKKVLIK